MKRLMQITLATAVVVLAATPALAQRGGFGFGGGGTVFLLDQKSVQQELKLTDDQVAKVKELSAKQTEAFQGLRDLSQEERREKMQEMNKANEKAVADLLKPDQLKRVKQISLQRQVSTMLGFALRNEELSKALNITDEQKEKMGEIQMSAFQEMQGLERNEEGAKKRQEIMKATNEKVMGLLTADQKAKLKEMQGEPFKGEIQTPQFRRKQ